LNKNPELVTREEIINDPRFKAVTIVPGVKDLHKVIARDLADKIKSNNAKDKGTTAILPVSPLDYTILAEICNKENISCNNFVIINMDEFVTKDGNLISRDHPLSFGDYMNRNFYDLLKDELKVPKKNRFLPNPHDLEEIQRVIDARGGVDVCYGGFGISGHVAYNEPCTQEELGDIEYDTLPTRIVNLVCASRTQVAMSTGGNLDAVPRKAITIGMKELMQAREMHIIAMRSWQPAVFRKAMYGPITPLYPASYLQKHNNLKVTIIEKVAELPELLPA